MVLSFVTFFNERVDTQRRRLRETANKSSSFILFIGSFVRFFVKDFLGIL